jgi:hypothetical protein
VERHAGRAGAAVGLLSAGLAGDDDAHGPSIVLTGSRTREDAPGHARSLAAEAGRLLVIDHLSAGDDDRRPLRVRSIPARRQTVFDITADS